MLHTGAFGAIGGLITSIHDFGKYVAFHMSAWPAHSGPDGGPVQRSTLREMHTPTHLRLSPDAKDASGAPCPSMRGYGYGLIARTDCHGVHDIQDPHSKRAMISLESIPGLMTLSATRRFTGSVCSAM